MARKISEQEKKDLRARLARFGVRPGATVWTIVRHRSSSGMFRVIQLITFKKGEPYFIGRTAAELMGFGWDERREGVRVSGCGMDMAFHLVYTLGRCMFPKGGPIAKSNHIRQMQAPGEKRETDGGYLLRHRWL
jgi:hypothetical protein